VETLKKRIKVIMKMKMKMKIVILILLLTASRLYPQGVAPGGLPARPPMIGGVNFGSHTNSISSPKPILPRPIPLPRLTPEQEFNLTQIAIEQFLRSVPEIKKKAQRGDNTALFNLGNLYRMGLGVPLDFKKSFRSFEKAANNGHAPSQFNLATCYHTGNGVAKSFENAYVWYNIAAANGYSFFDERKNLVVAARWRDFTAQFMSSERVAKSQTRARAFFNEMERKKRFIESRKRELKKVRELLGNK
jgi:TPR repeat protein